MGFSDLFKKIKMEPLAPCPKCNGNYVERSFIRPNLGSLQEEVVMLKSCLNCGNYLELVTPDQQSYRIR